MDAPGEAVATGTYLLHHQTRESGARGETARAGITTILFTNLVDSTALMRRGGDERAESLFETHHQLLSVVRGGSELQWLGDGLMVAFASPADAVRCTISMQQAAAQPPGESDSRSAWA